MNNTPSQKSIYKWNLLGNFAAAAVSVLYLLIVSRMQTSEVADQFSLATSIGNLWIIIGQFQVRMEERQAGESYLTFSRSIKYMIHMFVSILFIQNFRERGK